MTLGSFTTSLDALMSTLGGAEIPELETADPRHLFAFLVDTSGSTSRIQNGLRDIDKINEAMAQLVQQLKYPPPSSPLAQVHDQIDILLIAYASDPQVVIDWTPASALPDQLPVFTAGGGTAMGGALNMGLDKVLARQLRYKEQGLPRCGLPHIFNITDGDPTDVKVGDRLWTEIEQKLAKAASDPAKKSLLVRHFLSPNGYVASAPGTVTGAEQIAKWFGASAIVPLDDGANDFQNLVELVVKTITVLSQPGADPEAVIGKLKKTKRKD
jgi:uncharacterized protein YegL